jgi:uncharacterized protein YpmB
MQQVKTTDDYTVFQKKSGRYAVQGKDKKWLHGEDKVRVLVGEALVKVLTPKAPAAEAPAEA